MRQAASSRLLVSPVVAAACLLAGCSDPAGSPLEGHHGRTALVTPDDPAWMPSWHDRAARARIVDFIARVTDPSSPDFVPAAERIATFDNDGCLWAERPVYFQLLFALDRVRDLAPEHPEWRTTEPFASVLAGDLEKVAEGGEHAIVEIVAATHGDTTTEEFADAVREWLETARHPESGRPFDEMTYAPMVELLDYLRAHDFTTFIVSGGGIDFLRVFAEDAYGIPPHQVVGSSVKTTFEPTDAGPVIRRLAEIDFIDDKDGKPLGIHRHVGRRPIFAAGNSDGDHQMLQWTAAGDGPSLCLLVHHTDAEREWAYDRDSHVGRLDRALDEARTRDWVVVDMAEDWARVFRSPIR